MTSLAPRTDGLLAVLREAASNADLRRLQLASVAWATGEATYLVGLLVVAYDLGGAAAVAVLAVVRALPSVLAVPVLTALIDRVPADRQLRLVLAVRIASVAAATALLLGTPVGSLEATSPALILLLVLAAIDAVAAAMLRPIRGALVPGLARSPEELVAANVATSTGESLAALAGPAVAAVLLVTVGPGLCLVVGTGFLVLAGAASLGLRLGMVGHVAAHDRRSEPARRRARPRGGGLRDLAGLRHARLIVAVFVSQRFVRGMLTVLVVAAAIELLRMGDAGVGVLSSAVGFGGLVGGAAALGLVSRRRLVPWFLLGVMAWGIGIALPGIIPVPLLAGLALAFAGAGKVVLDVSGFSLLQRTVPSESRPRVLGALEGLVTAALALGSVAAAWLVEALGAGGAMLAAGAIPFAAGALAWLPLRRADDEAVIPERELRLLRTVPLFRPLRLNSLELLAAAVEWTAVDAGREIVTEAEYGDRFYVIESGRFEVVAGGARIRELSAGDSFGEIALLHARPRTATVIALEDGVLASIDGEAFLAAVTAHEESAAAAQAQATERLAAAGG